MWFFSNQIKIDLNFTDLILQSHLQEEEIKTEEAKEQKNDARNCCWELQKQDNKILDNQVEKHASQSEIPNTKKTWQLFVYE